MARKKRGVKKVQHNPFWAVLGIVVLLVIGAVVFAAQQDLSGVGKGIQVISYVTEGAILPAEVKDVQGVQGYTLYVKDTIKEGKVFVEQKDSVPFEGIVFSAFTVSSEDQDKISKIDFTLKIKEQDLLRQGISREDVRLFANGKELQTILTEKKEEYFYYTAAAEELGTFVIGKKSMETTKEQDDEDAGKSVQVPSLEERPVPMPEPIIEKPQPVEERKGFWAKIVEFFQGIFG